MLVHTGAFVVLERFEFKCLTAVAVEENHRIVLVGVNRPNDRASFAVVLIRSDRALQRGLQKVRVIPVAARGDFIIGQTVSAIVTRESVLWALSAHLALNGAEESFVAFVAMTPCRIRLRTDRASCAELLV